MSDSETPDAPKVETQETAPAAPPPDQPGAEAAPAADAAPAGGESGVDVIDSFVGGKPPEGEPAEGAAREGRGRRRKKRGGGSGAPQQGGGAPAPGGQGHGHGHGGQGGRSFVEDQIDREAEHLARDARTIPTNRVRPLGILAQEVRRLAASGDPRDAREARRALVLLKSKVAFLAGREIGRERRAFAKVREFVFRGVDGTTRNRETPDAQQLRNFLDQLEAFVAYHRYHCDERRRD